MADESRLGRWKAKAKAKEIQTDTYALALAARDPRTPWTAKALAAVVIGYALSPIDLIPDFIPVLGVLDDLILIPAGIALVLKLIPPGVMAECRVRARVAAADGMGKHRVAGVVIIGVWIGILAIVGLAVARAVR